MVYKWIANNLWDLTTPGAAKRWYEAYKEHPNPTIRSNAFNDWLTGEYNEEKLNEFRLLYRVPGVGNYMDYLLDLRDDKQYLKRNGMDYSDIRDPRGLSSVSSGANFYYNSYQMISKNLEDLYKDDDD